ncbi:MAG: TetR/AcrR family transcriptional regulator [Planctomycetota bacterium]|jgi:AcrR family transcriptional regulator
MNIRIRSSTTVPTRSDTPWVRPRQARSHETLDRLCAAAERLLEHQHFDQLTIEAIAAEAGCSVGGFYGRFRDKDALLACLLERYREETRTTVEDALAPERWAGTDLAERVEAVARIVVETCRRRGGLLRTLHIRTHMAGCGAERGVAAVPTEHQRLGLETIRALLLDRADRMRHPDPATATHLALFALMTTIQEKVLFPHAAHARAVDVDDETLICETTRAFLAYVEAPKE